MLGLQAQTTTLNIFHLARGSGFQGWGLNSGLPLARQPLYQLSYLPSLKHKLLRCCIFHMFFCFNLAAMTELVTSPPFHRTLILVGTKMHTANIHAPSKHMATTHMSKMTGPCHVGPEGKLSLFLVNGNSRLGHHLCSDNIFANRKFLP